MSIQETINQIAGITTAKLNKKQMFDTPVIIKLSPHTWPINIYGIEIDPFGNVWLMDNNGDWHKLEATDKNADVVANSVLQRIKTLTYAASC